MAYMCVSLLLWFVEEISLISNQYHQLCMLSFIYSVKYYIVNAFLKRINYQLSGVYHTSLVAEPRYEFGWGVLVAN